MYNLILDLQESSRYERGKSNSQKPKHRKHSTTDNFEPLHNNFMKIKKEADPPLYSSRTSESKRDGNVKLRQNIQQSEEKTKIQDERYEGSSAGREDTLAHFQNESEELIVSERQPGNGSYK